MKNWLSIFFCASLSFGARWACAQPGRKAITALATIQTFLVDPKYGQAVTDLLNSHLAGATGIDLLRRSGVGKTLSKRNVSFDDIVNPTLALRAGKVLGANQMLIGSVGRIGLKIALNVRLVDGASGHVLRMWCATGDTLSDLPKMVEELSKKIALEIGLQKVFGTNGVDISGYWISEWYDVYGKHPGSLYLEQNDNVINGWTLEDIGAAKLSATWEEGSLQGAYTAHYGVGKFEFTVSDDGQRLIGSYTGQNGSHGTWIAWRHPENVAPPEIGSRVFAGWRGDFWSYPATIKGIDDHQYLVGYDDGDSGWINRDQVYSMDLMSGDNVFVAQSDKRNYAYATVMGVNGDSIQVEYKDGRQGEEALSRIRLLLVNKSGYH